MFLVWWITGLAQLHYCNRTWKYKRHVLPGERDWFFLGCTFVTSGHLFVLILLCMLFSQIILDRNILQSVDEAVLLVWESDALSQTNYSIGFFVV